MQPANLRSDHSRRPESFGLTKWGEADRRIALMTTDNAPYRVSNPHPFYVRLLKQPRYFLGGFATRALRTISVLGTLGDEFHEFRHRNGSASMDWGNSCDAQLQPLNVVV